MNILITGANGFIGRNLTEQLKNIRDGKCNTALVKIEHLYTYDLESTQEELETFCKNADFVFHLAGVNRPETRDEYMPGNCGCLKEVLKSLKKYGNTCPVMMSSSVQAALDNPYGKSKLAAEQLLSEYSHETGAKVLIYRFPNVFGKWCRPNYNSAVATFCYNISHDLPITVHDRNTTLTLVYIDDVVEELIAALQGRENTEGDFCFVSVKHRITLGEMVDLLYRFKSFSANRYLIHFPENSFEKKLFTTFLSYFPKDKAVLDLPSKSDERGSFTELVHTLSGGQFSVNISKPGITKGQHWHHTKWEMFIVIKGTALIEQRKIGTNEVLSFRVSDEKFQAVCMLPGYTHNIVNLSETDELITLMWANENFDAAHPDTYYETV